MEKNNSISDQSLHVPHDISSRHFHLSSLFQKQTRGLVALFFIIAAIALTVHVAGQRQNIRQDAAQSANLVSLSGTTIRQSLTDMHVGQTIRVTKDTSYTLTGTYTSTPYITDSSPTDVKIEAHVYNGSTKENTYTASGNNGSATFQAQAGRDVVVTLRSINADTTFSNVSLVPSSRDASTPQQCPTDSSPQCLYPVLVPGKNARCYNTQKQYTGDICIQGCFDSAHQTETYCQTQQQGQGNLLNSTIQNARINPGLNAFQRSQTLDAVIVPTTYTLTATYTSTPIITDNGAPTLARVEAHVYNADLSSKIQTYQVPASGQSVNFTLQQQQRVLVVLKSINADTTFTTVSLTQELEGQPTPTPIGTATPTPITTALPAPIFEDNFDDNRNQWGPHNTDEVAREFTDGIYRIMIKRMVDNSELLYASSYRAFNNHQWTVMFDFTLRAITDEYRVGLTFGHSSDFTFNRFYLEHNGTSRTIFTRSLGESRISTKQGQPQALQENKTYKLRVDKSLSELKAWLSEDNGATWQKVGQYPLDPAQATVTHVGPVVFTKTIGSNYPEARFDNFKMWNLGQIPEPTAATDTAQPASSTLNFSLKLEGITSNAPLKKTTIPVRVAIFRNNQQVSSTSTTASYQAADGTFTGSFSVTGSTNDLAFRFKPHGFLRKTASLISTDPFVAGDVTGDNVINDTDVTAINNCIGYRRVTTTCQYSETADLNADDIVDGTDYNTTLRNANKSGEAASSGF